MKKIFATLFFSLVFAIGFAQQPAQPKPVSADAAFSEALNKVVQDFTSNFIHIQGEKMPADVDADTYKSKVCVPGALGCKIMRYRSAQDKTANWQAGLYEGENFSEALKFYKKIIAQVKKTSVRGVAASGAGFDGKTENVDENVGFAVTTLRMKTTNKTYKDLVAEVEMNSNFTGWEVRLNVYTKKLVEEEKEQEEKQ
jgi:hypothetical protein